MKVVYCLIGLLIITSLMDSGSYAVVGPSCSEGTLSIANIKSPDGSAYKDAKNIAKSPVNFNEGAGSYEVTVQTTGDCALKGIPVVIKHGTASSSQVTISSTSLNIAAAGYSTSFTVDVDTDAVYTGNTTFTVAIASPSKSTTLGSPAQINGVFVDGDSPNYGTVSIASTTYSVNEGAGNISVTINRTGGSDGYIDFDYETQNVTALAGTHYTADSGTLFFNDGDTTPITVDIPITDDSINAGDLTFKLRLYNENQAGILGTDEAIITRLEDDNSGEVGFVKSQFYVYSGALEAQVELNRQNGIEGQVLVDLTTAHLTTTNDQVAAETQTITLEDQESSKVVGIKLSPVLAGLGVNRSFSATLSNFRKNDGTPLSLISGKTAAAITIIGVKNYCDLPKCSLNSDCNVLSVESSTQGWVPACATTVPLQGIYVPRGNLVVAQKTSGTTRSAAVEKSQGTVTLSRASTLAKNASETCHAYDKYLHYLNSKSRLTSILSELNLQSSEVPLSAIDKKELWLKLCQADNDGARDIINDLLP